MEYHTLPPNINSAATNRIEIQFDEARSRLCIREIEGDTYVTSLRIATRRDFMTLIACFTHNIKHLTLTLKTLFDRVTITAGKTQWASYPTSQYISTDYTVTIGPLTLIIENKVQKREIMILRRFGFDMEVTEDFIALIPKHSTGLRYLDHARYLINGDHISYRIEDPEWFLHNKITQFATQNAFLIDGLFPYYSYAGRVDESARYTENGHLKRKVVIDPDSSSVACVPVHLKMSLLNNLRSRFHDIVRRCTIRRLSLHSDVSMRIMEINASVDTEEQYNFVLPKALDLFYEFSFSSSDEEES